jgi:hypothetical protein
MSIAENATREDKMTWLLRPIEWSSHVAFFGTIFGFVLWYFGVYDADWIVVALCVAMGVNFGLVTWGVSRLSRAARRS